MIKTTMLTLTSNPKNINRIEPFIETLVHQYSISPDLYGNILISVTEAVTNAIVHGNQADESKNVCITCHKKSNRLAIQVADEGPGFDYENLPDPTLPENILRVGGRGVFLMKQLADEVNFIDEGRVVEIQFSI